MSSERTIILGGRAVTYVLTKKSISRMTVRVHAAGKVTVSAPTSSTVADVERFLRSKESFLLSAIEKMSGVPERLPRSFADGGRMYVAGKPVTIRVRPGQTMTPRVSLEPGVLAIRCADPSDAERVSGAVEKWMKERCREKVTPMLERLCPRLEGRGIPRPKALRFGMMTSRWGSNSGRTEGLSFSGYLVMLPDEVIEHVVLHELCHFVHRDHSKAFYALLAELDPKSAQHRAYLKNAGWMAEQ